MTYSDCVMQPSHNTMSRVTERDVIPTADHLALHCLMGKLPPSSSTRTLVLGIWFYYFLVDSALCEICGKVITVG